MLTAPIAAYMLNHDGWRAGLWAFAILAVAMLPAAWIGSRADRLPNSGGDRPRPHPDERARTRRGATRATS